MTITISGTPGSGKSTLAKSLAKWLKYRRVDMGTMQRSMAKQRGLTYEQYLKVLERNRRGDRAIDNYQRRLGRTAKNLIVESRLAFHFIPKAMKIFVAVSPHVGANRIWGDLKKSNRRNEGTYSSAPEVERAIRKRMRSDRWRYLRYYGVNPFVKRHYDLWLDTSRRTPEQVYRRAHNFVVENLRQQSKGSSTRKKSNKKRR